MSAQAITALAGAAQDGSTFAAAILAAGQLTSSRANGCVRGFMGG
jgi:hypothetical protein